MKNLFKLAPAKTLAALLFTVTTAFCATASDIPNSTISANNLIFIAEVHSVNARAACHDIEGGRLCCTSSSSGVSCEFS